MAFRTMRTKLEGVVIIEADALQDERGFFLESYHKERFAEHGLDYDFVQENHSRSARKVLRGIHYQDMTAPMAKLVRCIAGEILDVAVDLRAGSPTFGQWLRIALTAENKRQLLVPVGFGHGFVTLSRFAEVCYKCTDYYTPSAEGTIAWDDRDLGVEWLIAAPILSERDRAGMSLQDYLKNPAFIYQAIDPMAERWPVCHVVGRS